MPDAGRVVTGSAGGLRLEAPGPGTRPFSDKVKQALFSMLEAEDEHVWDHAVLDLFAGSGAAGIEALSRGAPVAVLVEQDRRAVETIRRNLERTRLADAGRVVRADVLGFLDAPPPEAPFGAIVVDPPYAQAADLLTVMQRLAATAADWLIDDGQLAAKHFWKDALPEAIGSLVRIRRRRFGETALSVYRRVLSSTSGGS